MSNYSPCNDCLRNPGTSDDPDGVCSNCLYEIHLQDMKKLKALISSLEGNGKILARGIAFLGGAVMVTDGKLQVIKDFTIAEPTNENLPTISNAPQSQRRRTVSKIVYGVSHHDTGMYDVLAIFDTPEKATVHVDNFKHYCRICRAYSKITPTGARDGKCPKCGNETLHRGSLEIEKFAFNPEPDSE